MLKKEVRILVNVDEGKELLLDEFVKSIVHLIGEENVDNFSILDIPEEDDLELSSQELTEFLMEVDKVKSEHEEWRLGQTMFNVLLVFRPKLAEKIRATYYDPFYDNQKIQTFLERITGGENE